MLGTILKTAAQYGIPAGISWLANRGDKKVANEATQQQMELARALMQMQQQQFRVDLPFRKALYNRLNQRAGRTQPRIMPGRAPLSNPYRNVRRVNPFDLRTEQTRTQTVGPRQNPLASLLRGVTPQTTNRLLNTQRQFAGMLPTAFKPKERPDGSV